VVRAIAEHEDVTRALEQAYLDWKAGYIELKRMAAIETAKKFSWDNTARLMSDTLLKVITQDESSLVLKHIL